MSDEIVLEGPMRKVIDRLYVGGDLGVAKAKERGFSRICACKDGPDGHRAMLGYTELGAPKGPDYLYASKGHVFAMNVVDNDDASMIASEIIFEALKWAKKEWDAGRSLYFHCNHGHGRGPGTAMAFMRAIGELPHPYTVAKRVFKTLYENADHRETGMMMKVHELWAELPRLFNDEPIRQDYSRR